MIRVPVEGIRISGRNTQGVKIMNLTPGDLVWTWPGREGRRSGTTVRAMRTTLMPRGRPRSPRRARRRRRRSRRRRRKSSVVSAQDVREAAAGLAGVAVRTPLRFVEPLNAYLKLESLQPSGAFKLRGAYNAVRRLLTRAPARVITYSSGNHGQALAYAAQLVGVRAVVVMPETAPAVKVAGVKKWGGKWCSQGVPRTTGSARPRGSPRGTGLAIVPRSTIRTSWQGRRPWGSRSRSSFPPSDGAGARGWGWAHRRRGDGAGGGRQSRCGVGGRARRRPEAQALAGGGPPGAARAHRQHRGRPDHARRGELPFAQLAAHRDRVAGVALVDDDALREAYIFSGSTAIWRGTSGAATTAAVRSGAVDPSPPRCSW